MSSGPCPWPLVLGLRGNRWLLRRPRRRLRRRRGRNSIGVRRFRAAQGGIRGAPWARRGLLAFAGCLLAFFFSFTGAKGVAVGSRTGVTVGPATGSAAGSVAGEKGTSEELGGVEPCAPPRAAKSSATNDLCTSTIYSLSSAPSAVRSSSVTGAEAWQAEAFATRAALAASFWSLMAADCPSMGKLSKILCVSKRA